MGYQQKIIGATVAPTLAGAARRGDDIDAAAAAFGSRLRLTIGANRFNVAPGATGARRAHDLGNGYRDHAWWASDDLTIAADADYDSATVLRFSGAAASDAASIDAKGRFRGADDLVECSVFGIASYDTATAMTTNGDVRWLFSIKNGSSQQQSLYLQRASGVDYLTAVYNQASGGGVNVSFATGGIAADTPFVFLARFTGTGAGAGTTRIYTDTVASAKATGTSVAIATTGTKDFNLGGVGVRATAWRGGIGRVIVVQGDALGEAADIDRSEAIFAAMKAAYGL